MFSDSKRGLSLSPSGIQVGLLLKFWVQKQKPKRTQKCNRKEINDDIMTGIKSIRLQIQHICQCCATGLFSKGGGSREFGGVGHGSGLERFGYSGFCMCSWLFLEKLKAECMNGGSCWELAVYRTGSQSSTLAHTS